MAENNNNTTATGWKHSGRMSVKRTSAGGIFANDHQFLVMGGVDRYQEGISSCEYYDTRTQKWTGLSIYLPTGLASFGIARVGTTLYVLGGSDRFTDHRCDVLALDVSGGDLSKVSEQHWQTLSPMPLGRSGFGCVSDGERYVYAVGGGGGNHPAAMDSALRYDTRTDEWKELPSMPEKRVGCALGMVGDRVYVVGGTDDERSPNEPTGGTLVLDATKQEWVPDHGIPDLPFPRVGVAVVTLHRFVLAIGGDDSTTHGDTSTIQVLDTVAKAWKPSSAPAEAFPGGVVAGLWRERNELLVAGGPYLDAACVISCRDGLLPFRVEADEPSGSRSRHDDGQTTNNHNHSANASNDPKTELLALNQKLLDAIVDLDYETYDRLCADDMSCLEPESNQNLVVGKSFHKYYFDVFGNHNTLAGGDGEAAPRTNVTMVQPHVQWIGDDQTPVGAVVSYAKLVQQTHPGTAPVTTQQSETRVWEKRGGRWVHIHFHKSPPAR